MSKVKGAPTTPAPAPAKGAPAPPAPAKGKFDAKAFAKNGVTEEEVNAIVKQAFDLFENPSGIDWLISKVTFL